MKDAYSFDRDTKGLTEIYEKMRLAYEKIFRRCGLDFVSVKADPGVIGGKVSHEFMVAAEGGEDAIFKCKICGEVKSASEAQIEVCPHCREDMEKINTLEIGHIFQLGEKYSKVLGVKFLDEAGKQQTVQMGCYGIGVSRLISAIIEQNHDKDGIVWPAQVAPYQVAIVPVNISDKEILDKACDIHKALEASGIECLLDDRDERAGVKFKDADLLGFPLRITLGNKWLKEKKLELKERRSQISKDIRAEDVLEEVRRYLQ